MTSIIFNHRRVINLSRERIVNKEHYLEMMRRLRENIRKKRPDLWRNNSWMLRRDNAPVHRSMLVTNFLAKNSTTIVPQAPYSSDAAASAGTFCFQDSREH
jgi:transposase